MKLVNVSVKVQDKEMREDGPIQGAKVTLWLIPKPLESTERYKFPRERVTGETGMAVFLVPPGLYRCNVNAHEYTAMIEDAVGNVADHLTIDTMMGGDQYPIFANMTRDE